jgi:hypothetical protein
VDERGDWLAVTIDDRNRHASQSMALFGVQL